MTAAIERLVDEAILALGRPTPNEAAEWIMRHRAAELRQALAGIARARRRHHLADTPPFAVERATAGDLF